jgi:hypothetical protein
VIGAQAGRLQLVLEKAFKPLAYIERAVIEPIDCSFEAIVSRDRLLPLCRPKSPEPPQPQVIVQPDPALNTTLKTIEVKLDRIAVNTAPPEKPAEKESATEMSPVIAALVVLGTIVLGFVIYFGTQKG